MAPASLRVAPAARTEWGSADVSDDKPGIGWKPLGAVLGVMLALGTLSVVFLGTQVSGILSTVGASVGTPRTVGTTSVL